MADLVDRAATPGKDATNPGKDATTPGKDAATSEAEATVRIRGLSSDGSGVGNSADGRVVFVPRTAPGDEVRVRITSGKLRWAKGQLRELLVPSPHRVPPACPYYEECGGCTLQHVAYAEQLHWKGDTVREALKRIAHVDIGFPEVVPSPKEHNYRSRLTFTLIRLPGGRVVAGFHHLSASNRIVDVDEGCILPEPAVASAWTSLRRAWGEGARRLPAGRKLRLTLRAVDEGVILVVEGGRGPGRADILLREVEGLVAVWAATPKGAGKLLAGLNPVHDTRVGETLRSGPTTFLQVNREASESLHRWVMEQAGVMPVERVVDAYCGVGQYGRDMARCGAEVLGIERDSGAAKAAARDAPEGFTVWTGAVEDRIAEVLPADLVVLNPPRSGVDARVTEALEAEGPGRLIYVSCAPATLARDIGRLSSCYEVAEVRAFDLFPQTAHVEVVVVLKRMDVEPASESAVESKRESAAEPERKSTAEPERKSTAGPERESAANSERESSTETEKS